ncbi:MAG: hypothetical protein AB7V15_07640 [Acidimicrobiia bacterium]
MSRRRHDEPRPRTAARLAAVLVALVATLAALLVGPTGAGAQDLPAGTPSQEQDRQTWSVRPTPTEAQPDRPNFSYEIEAGGTLSDSFRVRNFGTEPLPLTLYATDAVVTPAGELSLLPAEDEPTDAGTWVDLDLDELVVAPGEIVDVPFTLTVPAGVETGDHSAGIVTSFVAEGTEGDRPVLVDNRLGSRMHIRVTGELRPAIEISDVRLDYRDRVNPFGPGSLEVAYTVTNVGNVRLAADQVVRVEGLAGFGAKELVVERMPELIVGSSLSFTVEVPDVWPALRTEATVELTPVPVREGDEFDAEALGVELATATAWTLPWAQLATLLVLVGGPLLWRWRRRRRVRREDARVKAAVDAALTAQAADGASTAPAPPNGPASATAPAPAPPPPPPTPTGTPAAEDPPGTSEDLYRQSVDNKE